MSAEASIYLNGKILTMDDTGARASAVGVVGEKIVAVGTADQVRQSLPGGAREIDLHGKTMIPAFIDPHGHFPDPGFISLFRVNLSSPPLGGCRRLDHVFGKLRKKAGETPAGEWIMGVSFDHTAMEERRFPTRAELDAVSSTHPIWVIHASGHSGAANSMALERQGVTHTSEDPVGGRFLRDTDSGELNGVIEGLSAMGPLSDTHFLIDEERFHLGFEATRKEYLGQGVTFAQNSWAPLDMLRLFAAEARRGDPGIDLMILPTADTEPHLSNGSLDLDWPDNPHIRLGPRKLFSDGAFQMQTALLSEPYFKPANENYGICGLPYVEQHVLNAEVKKLHDLGYQIHTHANGDTGADMFLDALELALKANPRSDHRHTIIHGQVLREDQLDRMARLGVTVSFFSAHIYYWGDRHFDTFLGPERARRISPAKSAAQRGIRFTIHNDAAVTPTRPLHLVSCAVNRLTASGMVLGEDQKISAEQALRAHTIDAAWQVFLEHERGSIEPGKLAEFAVLSGDPIADPDGIAEMYVEETIRRGKTVYTAELCTAI
ncbi:amidohydrolase [Hoeflea sp. TYP-13]|uniref:amidohydrolase n=1 Tax=Hoeflea sp. TYP-13 TaxID=3230023 RepID=UPI0034C5C793